MNKEAKSICIVLLCICFLLSCVNKDYPTEEVQETNQFKIDNLLQEIKVELNDLESISIESDTVQAIQKDDNEEDTIIQNRFTQYNDSPYVMYQQIETTQTSANSDDKQTQLAQYITNDLAYVFNHQSGVWMNVPIELREDLQFHKDPKEELQQYLITANEYSQDMTMQESEHEYEIYLKGEGMEARSAVIQSLELSSLLNEQQSNDLVNHMEIRDLQFIVNVDKETSMINWLDINVQLAMKHNGELINMNLETSLSVHDFNKTELDGIPEEIIDNAEEYKMELGNLK